MSELELDENFPISKINAESSSYKFLEDESDLYSLEDLKVKYE